MDCIFQAKVIEVDLDKEIEDKKTKNIIKFVVVTVRDEDAYFDKFRFRDLYLKPECWTIKDALGKVVRFKGKLTPNQYGNLRPQVSSVELVGKAT